MTAAQAWSQDRGGCARQSGNGQGYGLFAVCSAWNVNVVVVAAPWKAFAGGERQCRLEAQDFAPGRVEAPVSGLVALAWVTRRGSRQCS